MGLNASSDEWCCHSGRIIEGLPWARKIVDDTLIWAENLDILKERIIKVLDRCREFNVTISKKKFEIGEIIDFAGHMISATGIRPDDKKYDATNRHKILTHVLWLGCTIRIVYTRSKPSTCKNEKTPDKRYSMGMVARA